MSIDVMLVVLAGALLHAGWNVLLKGAIDPLLSTILVTGSAGAVGVVLAAALPLPAPASWPYIAASVVIHVGYFALVAAAYRFGDLSIVYPIARGGAPLGTALVATAAIGEHLSAGAWIGIGLLSGGILFLTLDSRKLGGTQPRAVGIAATNALVIIIYTIVDGIGVRLAGGAAAYIAWMLALTAVPLLAYAYARRRTELLRVAAIEWPRALAGGASTVGSYGLALWAMTQAPVALVAALRETSVIFGTVMATVFLRERFGARRYLAASMVAAGAICMKAL